MNRIEFMTELAALLQDISEEDRRDAMQYYNDYFDDAGVENEQKVIAELESPSKVAQTIKADLGSRDNYSQEYTETGYTDTRFEQKETPVTRGYHGNTGGEGPRSSPVLKVILIIAIILIGSPVIIPVALAIVTVIAGCVIGLFCVFIALVIASIAVTIAGISVFCVGVVNLIPQLAVGIALIGVGLVLTVLGLIATVATVRLCIIVFPGICRGIVWICRKPFEGRTVA